MRLPALTCAALAATLVAAVAGPASAADPGKGAGSAMSAGSLLSLSVAGQTLEALRLRLPTSTGLDGSRAQVSVTPLLRGGAPVVPAVEVPAGESRELPSQTAGVPGLVELVTPTGTLSAAADAASARAQAVTGVGDLRLFGTDLLGDGSVRVSSTVTGTGSAGTKHLVLDGLALPTLADLLAALGLDVTELPVGTLLELLDVTRLLDPAVLQDLLTLVEGLDLTTVTDLLDVLEGHLAPAEVTQLLRTAPAPADLESAVSSVSSTLAGLTASLPTTQTGGYAKSALLEGVLGPILQPVVGDGTDLGTGTGGTDGGTTVPVVDDLTGGTLGDVLDQLPTGVVTELTADINAVLADPTDRTKLQDLITTVTTTLVELVQDVLDTLLGGQLPAVADLPALLDTSLLSLDGLEVTTVARTGADELAEVTGTVTGLEVLGTDALEHLLGSTTADLTTLLGEGGLGQVQGLIDSTLGSVTDVLGDAGLGIVLPMPEVHVLEVEEQVAVVDGVRTARAGVEALTLTWALDEVRIPAAVSDVVGGVTGGLPVALPLGGLAPSALPTGQLTALLSQPMSLTVGTLVDTSGFTPGAPVAAPAPGTPSTGSPGTSVPGAPGTRAPGTVLTPAPGRQLPRTGASALLAAVALAMVGSAFALRRRNEALAVDEA